MDCIVHGVAKHWTWLSNFHFDYMDLCRQSNISVLICCLVCHCFSKEQASFNFMAVVIIHSDFGAQEKKVCHYFHLSPIYLPWSDGIRCCDLCFFQCWVLSQLFHSPFSASSRGSVIPLLFAIRVVSSETIELLKENIGSMLFDIGLMNSFCICLLRQEKQKQAFKHES